MASIHTPENMKKLIAEQGLALANLNRRHDTLMDDFVKYSQIKNEQITTLLKLLELVCDLDIPNPLLEDIKKVLEKHKWLN